MKRRFRASAAALAAATSSFLLLASSDTAHAQVQTKQQQKCINAVNKALAGLANAQLNVLAACNRDADGAGMSRVQACFLADARNRIGKAQVKLASAATKACLPGQLPDFAHTTASHADVLSFAEAYTRELEFLFGSAWGTFVRGTAEEACTTPAVKTLHKYFVAQLKELNKCKKAELKVGVASDDLLAGSCGAALAPIGLEAVFTAECGGANLAAVFQGICNGDVTTASACMESSTKCGICRLTAGADDLPIDCDTLDDGLANSSCERDDYVAGAYAGTFSSSSPALAGALDASVSQTGAAVSGSATIEVAPPDEPAFTACYGVNPVTGSITGEVSGQSVTADLQLSNPNGDVIHLVGTMAGGSLSGTFTQTVGPCASIPVTGTFSVTELP